MTEEQAIDLLKHHSSSHADINNPKWEKGFLGMLRPFTGDLYEENYKELLEIIDVLSPKLKANTINRDIIADLWTICHCTYIWALDKGGMLQRNKLLTPKQITTLTDWYENISWKIFLIFEGEENNIPKP